MRFFTESALSKTRRLTPEGFLICEGVKIARIGEMEYRAGEVPGVDPGDDGLVRMSRTCDELFAPETISSFEGKPVTIQHPGDLTVTPDTWGDTAIGHVQGVRRGSGENADYLIADLVINDSTAIERVNNGLRELSCGYEYVARQTERGRGGQYEIRGNHVALVDRARGGTQLKIGDRRGLNMAIKNKWLRLFGLAVKAGDEETQKEIEEEMEKDKKDDDEDDAKKEKSGDSLESKVTALDAKIGILSELVAKLVDPPKPDIKAGDSEPDWQEIISGAAIIAPKLAIDKTGVPAQQKAKAIDAALLGDYSDQAKRIIGGRDTASLSDTEIGSIFTGIVEVGKAVNNARSRSGDSATTGFTFSGQDMGGFEIVRHKK